MLHPDTLRLAARLGLAGFAVILSPPAYGPQTILGVKNLEADFEGGVLHPSQETSARLALEIINGVVTPEN